MSRLRWIVPLLLVLGAAGAALLHAGEADRERADCARRIAAAGRAEAARRPAGAETADH
ncbi:MAG: hypothetical protein QOI80_1785, partial [Solirubrobacteraceae bacterium]|nr:hypothetical protein [Solirubrobacteraceae bacterium]